MFFTFHSLEAYMVLLQLMVIVTVMIVVKEFCHVGVQNVEYANV